MQIGFTEQLSLDAIRNPLQIYGLKGPETRFLDGITSQTIRLEYSALRAWLWWNVHEDTSGSDQTRTGEHLATMASVLHHQPDSTPTGVRQASRSETWVQELKQASGADLGEALAGAQTYGEQYHDGPLASLRLVWTEDGDVVVTRAGEKLAKAYHEERPSAPLVLRDDVPRYQELTAATDLCLCGHAMSRREQELWQLVLLGFLEWTGPKVDFDRPSARAHRNGDVDHEALQTRAIGELMGITKWEDEETDPSGTRGQAGPYYRDLLRRYTLLLFLKVADAVQPPTSPKGDFHYAIRDGVQHRHVAQGGSWDRIEYGELSPIRDAWAVLIHNLYLISLWEILLGDLAKAVQNHPFGTTLPQILPQAAADERETLLLKWGIDVSGDATYEAVLEAVPTSGPPKMPTWERNLLETMRRPGTQLERWSAAVVLHAVLEYRRAEFDPTQRTLFQRTVSDMVHVSPVAIGEQARELPLPDVFKLLGDRVFRQHQHAAAYKYRKNRTKAWVLVGDDGFIRLHDPDKRPPWSRFRESRVRNAFRMLDQLDLIDEQRDRYVLTQEGSSWLSTLR